MVALLGDLFFCHSIFSNKKIVCVKYNSMVKLYYERFKEYEVAREI